MTRAAAVAAAVGLALLFVGATSAGSTKSVTLDIGDSFEVAGTKVFCTTQIGRTLLKGKKVIACYKLRGSAPIVGSYSSALAADGEIAVARLKRNGADLVFRRGPARLGKNRTVRANLGDELLLAGTKLACSVGKGMQIYVSCFRYNAKGGIVGSHGYAAADNAVAVVQFTTPVKTKLVKTFTQPA